MKLSESMEKKICGFIQDQQPQNRDIASISIRKGAEYMYREMFIDFCNMIQAVTDRLGDDSDYGKRKFDASLLEFKNKYDGASK